ncbi:MAG: hypothetical protein ABIA59_03510, partial [Candidatus Latescibacterota bacterium]
MDTKRPPALTSPWKIGFLVSLLLISLSIGVNYLIFRTFNLSWSSVGFKEGSWFFYREQFMNELLPLVALVALAALISYFIITSAVRRYKAFLDSGLDYRRLISLIEKSDDLESDNFGRGLGKYPELRTFLLSVRDQIRKKEKELRERENKLAKKGSSDPLFEKECGALSEAAHDLARGQFDGELAITSPALVRIADALRSAAGEGGEKWEIDGRDLQIKDIIEQLRQAGDELKNNLSDSSAELEAGCVTAKEMETQLCKLMATCEEAAGSTPARADDDYLHNMKQSLKTYHRLCADLADVGEETKGIAINTALRAGSGEGSVEDLIQLSEDVRRVALRFIELSQSYVKTSDLMQSAIANLESERASAAGRSCVNSDIASSIAALKNKMALWVERIIILTDNLKNSDSIIDLSLAPIDESLGGLAGDAKEDASEIAVDIEDVSDDFSEKIACHEANDGELELETSDSGAFGAKRTLVADLPEVDEGYQDIPGIEKSPEHIFSRPVDESATKEIAAKQMDPAKASSSLEHEAEFEEMPGGDEPQKETAASMAGGDDAA